MCVSIDFRYVVEFIRSRNAFQCRKTIQILLIFRTQNITSDIHIPPNSVIVNAIPSMAVCAFSIGCSINDIARNVLTTAERSEQVGKVKAKTFLGAKRFTDIKVLKKGIAVIVVFEVRYDPVMERLCFF